MSDKKIIDVRDGDTFGADAYLCQMRGDEFRNFEERGVTGWTKTTRYAGNPKLRPVSRKDAELMIRMAGYTLTPTKPEQAVVCSTCRTFGCDDHVPDAGKMVPTLAATVKRLEERVAKLEAATTPAKVRVVAPDMARGGTGSKDPSLACIYKLGAEHQDARWRAALAAAGVEVKEASK